MNDLMSQLKDIQGLDKVSWWPLAIGWWIVIGILAAAAIAALALYIHKRTFSNSWKGAISKVLADMQKSLGDKNSQEIIMQLSETLRKIAIKRFSRLECAGLSGEKWLQFLSQNDPAGFDWVNNGKLLINAPYAPSANGIPTGDVKTLINAAGKWVK